MDAPDGLHSLGEPGDPVAVVSLLSGDQLDSSALWLRWNGLEIASGHAVIFCIDEIPGRTESAIEDERLVEGCKDLVVGTYGNDLLVIAGDPWEEGADILLVEEDGQRNPFASNSAKLVAILLGDFTVLCDEEGEYREGIFGEDGELTPEADRRLQRRRLDHDQDGPYARFLLAQNLRRSGEARAARRELELMLRRAPNYLWAHFELGRACLSLDERRRAVSAFAEAARLCEAAADRDSLAGLQAFALAWQASAATAEQRPDLSAKIRAIYPGFALAQEHGARSALEAGDEETARERIGLGLIAEVGHLGLLGLRGRLSCDTSGG